MTESRYPGLDQANGEHRDSFATRFADRAPGYDSGAQPASGGGSGSNGSPASGSNGYDPGATQFSYGPADAPAAAAPSAPPATPAAPAAPLPPLPPLPSIPAPSASPAPDSGATRAVGPDSGATRSAPPDYSGYDLSKIGGTATYGSGTAAPPASLSYGSGTGASPASPSYGSSTGAPPASPSYGSGAPASPSYGSGFSGSVTGYDPANYTPPSSYGQPYGSVDGSTYRVGRDGSVKKLGVDTQTGLSPATGTVGRSSSLSAAPRGPRRARLQLKHIDPWSTMKFTLVMSVALFVVWMIAVGLLYGVLGGMGVWDKVNNLYDQVAGGNLITASFVLGSAAVVGAINIVLFTALATVGSFVYNLCSDLVGGIELTLSERD